ncbi:hypothetical protein [Oceanobacillus sp. Castelsardo]|uniref:hypothetical protein n=1 Tax=Oceanobacillus sp. Castelsardo TaxID=1851204 RepID=UPI0008388AC1|nr:hypothetical protein [Oceanobacillus sp. Castelsardo]
MKQIMLLILTVVLLVGCSNTDRSNSEISTTSTIDIRNVDVQVEELTANLVADVKTTREEIYYRIEMGEEVLQDEKPIQLNGEEWKPFEIESTLPVKVMEAEDAPIFVIYGKNEKGETTNPNYIPIEIK